MVRIPTEKIAEIKRSVPLEHLCRSRGIELTKHGSYDLKGKCPFHDDEEASFIITPEKNLFNCFGCGAGGSNIDFIMKLEAVSFRHAFEILEQDPTATGGGRNVKKSSKRKLASPLSLDADDHALMRQTIDYYHEKLLESKNALEYLENRGIKSLDTVKRFKLGYANRTLGYRIPNPQTKAGGEVKRRLVKLGLFRKSGHEHFNGCIVFPVFDEKMNVAEIYGRRIIRSIKGGTKHLYLPGPHVGVWNSDGVRNSQEWILCESIIDALSFYVNGFENVTASYGTRGFSPDHLRLIREAKPERVLIAYDNDDAGNSASNEFAQMMEAEKIEVWKLEIPPEKDINELISESIDPKGLLSSLLAAPVRMLPTGEAPAGIKKSALPERSDGTAKQDNFAKNGDGADTGKPGRQEDKPKSSFKSKGDNIEFIRGERAYRIRGTVKNTSFDHLKANVRLAVANRFHLDTFDLYNARQRTAFIAAACQVTGVEKRIIEEDISILIPRIEEEQERRIFAMMKTETKTPVMSPEEEQKALTFLRDPQLLDRILADFATAGTVGEESNKLIGYLVTVSRKLDDPLSAVIMSRSAAGKSSLLNAILDFVPEEDKEVMTSMTAQALFYMPADGLKHKVLALAEDEGSERACYPLKILQSEKVLVLAVTVKDQESGTMTTQQKKVDGPVAQLMTSTQAELDYELANRYLVLTVDEDREQTRRIHEAQRDAETLAGLLKRTEKEETLRVHHNAQRLLRPLHVVNPFAKKLTFPDDKLRLRRDHKKYLGLIRTVAFLRQYQKKIQSCEHRGKVIQYIEVDEQDLKLAHPLAVRALGRCLDELAPPVRSFLITLHNHVANLAKEREVKLSNIRLTQRDIRTATNWSDTQVRRYLERLIKMEYLIQHRIPGTGARYEYELFYDGQGQQGEAFLPFAEIESLWSQKSENPAKREENLVPSPSEMDVSPQVRPPIAV